MQITENKTLRVVTTMPGVLEPIPFVRAVMVNNRTGYDGFVFQLLRYIANQMHFNYTVVMPSDAQYGTRLANGSFTGIVGMLERKEADIGAADLTITHARNEVVDFCLVPFYLTSVAILIAEPNHQAAYDLWSFLRPFRWQVWLAYLVSCVAVFFVLYLVNTYYRMGEHQFRTAFECLYHATAGLLNQGLNISPATWWGQTLLTAWWLACLVEVASYSGFLVATLTAPSEPPLIISTVGDLANLVAQNRFKICIEAGTTIVDDIQDARVPEYATLKAWLSNNPQYIMRSSYECVAHVLSDRVAFIADLQVLQSFVNYYCNGTKLVILPERLGLSPLSFAFPKNSSLKTGFAKIIETARETGLLDHWYREQSSMVQECPMIDDRVQDYSLRPLSLTDFIGVFVITSLGLIVGSSAFVAERVYYLKRRLILKNHDCEISEPSAIKSQQIFIHNGQRNVR